MFEIKLIFYGLCHMLQFSEFVWALSYSLWDVFNNFLLIDATDSSKISSNQKRFLIALTLYSLSFFANTPFNYLRGLWIYPLYNHVNTEHTRYQTQPAPSLVLWKRLTTELPKNAETPQNWHFWVVFVIWVRLSIWFFLIKK